MFGIVAEPFAFLQFASGRVLGSVRFSDADADAALAGNGRGLGLLMAGWADARGCQWCRCHFGLLTD